jgi:RimJ/RimL family protein N-acetyltransferase
MKLRTKGTRGPGGPAAALAMVLKLVESAQGRWRAITGASLVAWANGKQLPHAGRNARIAAVDSDDGRPVPRGVVEQQQLPRILREYVDLPDGQGCFAAEETSSGAFLGWFSLRPATSVGLNGGTGLGYRMLPSFWGLGYATEGARAVVHHAFTELAVDRIVATTMTVNTASRRVMEKAGLSLIRTFFEEWPEPADGAEHGDVEYAVTREAWSRRHGDQQPGRRRW